MQSRPSRLASLRFIVLSLGLAAAAPAQQRVFETSWVGYDTGKFSTAEWPWAARVADLDGDGDKDVVSVNWWFFARMSVQLNQGDGTLAQPVHYNYAKGALDLVVSDITGDGVPDVIVANTGANWEGNTVSLFRGLGGGTFAAHQQFTVGTGSFVGPIGLAAADFTGDGREDVAVALYGYLGGGSQVALLANDGAGGFLPAQAFAAGLSPYKLAAGDLDGDGRPDLAVAHDDQTIAVLRNTGAGFAPPVSFTALGFFNTDAYQAIELSDVDKDGDLDVLYSSTTTSVNQVAAVALLRNPGNGTLGAAEALLTGAQSGGANDMAIGDVNGDAWPDILGVAGARWVLFRGNGSGGFLPAIEYGATEQPMAIELADMDGDGDLDPVVVGRDSLETAVYRNPGNGNFATPAPVQAVTQATVPSTSRGVDAADIDGDGDLDLAVPFSKVLVTSGGISILRGLGNGTFAAPVQYVSPLPAMYPHLVELNGDNRPDLLWADDYPPYDAKTRMNLGNGTFGPLTNWPMNTCGNGEVGALDVDDDGDLDMALCEYGGCMGGDPLSGRRVYIRRNNGDGTFGPVYVQVVSGFPERIHGADVNGDGHTDLLVTGNSWIDVCLGHGTGLFDPPLPPSAAACDWAPKGFLVRDLDGDGAPDIATTNYGDIGSGGESISVLLGHGDGTFAAPVTQVASYSHTYGNSRDIVACDPDGDGDLDLMAGAWGSLDVSFYGNRGAGAAPLFAPQVRYGTGENTLSMVAGDFTGDGTDDLGAMVSFGQALTFRPGLVLLRGTGAASAFVNLGHALPGTPGMAQLAGAGSLEGGSPLTLTLSGALGDSDVVRIVGLSLLELPFKGGVLVPAPSVLVTVHTDAAGAHVLSAGWPTGVPAGFTFYLQDWFADAGGPQGFAASNALGASTP